MERRNFFKLAPLGLVGLATSTVKGETPSSTVKAKMLTIMGPDGETYHPLCVPSENTEYPEVSPKPIIATTNRVSSSVFSVATSGEGTPILRIT